MRNIYLLLAACALLFAWGCEGDDDDFSDGEEYEGNEPGECSDGADNDSDGLFDCDDPGCEGSADCPGDDDDDDDDSADDDDDDTDDDDDDDDDNDTDDDDDDDTGPGGEWLDLDCGTLNTCGVRAGGTLECWGLDDAGQSTPPSGSGYRNVSVGENHGCALDNQNQAVCWGLDDDGQVSGLINQQYLSISAGARHTCAITMNGDIECWGNDTHGQITPQNPGGGYEYVAAGVFHNCATKGGGDVFCWGSDQDGQVSGLPPILISSTKVWCGYTSCWGLLGGGEIVGWGAEFAEDPPELQMVDMDVWFEHICGVDAAGDMTCWGDQNTFGQNIAVPGSYTLVSVGTEHTCAIDTAGDMTCWGGNDFGQTNVPN